MSENSDTENLIPVERIRAIQKALTAANTVPKIDREQRRELVIDARVLLMKL